MLREDIRIAERRADAERDRAEGLEDELAARQRRLDCADERRTIRTAKLLGLRETASRLRRERAAQTTRQASLARALSQVYGSRSWRWTAPLRAAHGWAGGSGLSSLFAARSLRGWAHAGRALLSPSRVRDIRAIARCGLFDEAFYLRMYPDVGRAGISAVVHYAVTGAHEGRLPHPLFDGADYLERHADVRESGANPLLHFVRHGAAAGWNPHPLFSIRYYLAANPDVQALASTR